MDQYTLTENERASLLEAQRKDFDRSVKELLSMPATAPRTDLWEAVARADLFLFEPAPRESRGCGASSYLIMATDGENTVPRPRVALRGKAKVLVVNGSGSVADLAVLNPLRFESIAAAVAYVMGEES